MHTFRFSYLALNVLLVLTFATLKAGAQAELVQNGSFETGDFTGWTVVQEAGSAGDWFVYSGATTPVSGFPILPPPDGTYAAISDQDENCSQILYQDIDIPPSDVVTCSVVVYYDNIGEEFASPPSLSYGGGFANQQARIDIMDPAAPDFDVGAGVLMNVFQTEPGDPFTLGYTTVNFNLTGFAGETVRFRAALASNRGYFPFAIDDVTCRSITSAQIPTMGEWGMIATAGILGLAGFIVIRRRKVTA